MKTVKELKKELREAVANYMKSEGCSCCRDIEQHKIDEERLAKLLGVSKHQDGSGYDFGKYVSKKNKQP